MTRRSPATARRLAVILASLSAPVLLAAAAAAQQPIPLDTLRATTGSRLVAGAAAATRSIEVIERADIDGMPVRSVADVLARVLGTDLQARSPAQADLSIRGGSFEQVLVMVDGVPVNDDQTGHFHLALAVPLDAVERIEVLRGPAAALYGSAAVGGVVNIVTRGGGAPAVRAQLGHFRTAAAGAELPVRLGPVTARASADYDRSDGHRAGTDHDIVQARLAADAVVAGGTARAHIGWAARDHGAAEFYAPYDSYEETRTLTAALGWQSAPARVTLAPRLSLRRHRDDFVLLRDDPAFYRNVDTSRQAAGELVLRWLAPRGVRVATGAEGVLSSLESTNLGNRHENRFAVFSEIAAGHADAVLVTGGLRVDDHASFGTHLSPSIAAGWRVAPTLRLRAAAAGGFRAPSWTERYYRDPANIASEELGAETFTSVEAGAVLGRRDRLHLDAGVFVRHARGLIDWARPSGAPADEPWRTMNVDRARFTGVEAAIRGNAGGAHVALEGSLLSLRAESATGFESKYALRPLTQTLALSASAPAAGFVLGGRAAAFHRAGAGAGHRVDLRVARDLGRLHFFVDATNLTDSNHDDILGQAVAGRAWNLGARMAF